MSITIWLHMAFHKQLTTLCNNLLLPVQVQLAKHTITMAQYTYTRLFVLKEQK